MFIFPNTHIGKYFTLKELLETDHTGLQQRNIKEATPEIINNLRGLVCNILDPLREIVGSPLDVSSGFRCPQLNDAVGGQPSSQHKKGQAADLKDKKNGNASLFYKIQKSKLPYDQLIWEFGTNAEPAWVHVSYGPRNRRQILYIGVK